MMIPEYIVGAVGMLAAEAGLFFITVLLIAVIRAFRSKGTASEEKPVPNQSEYPKM